jgi:uncharacterized protein DUF4058
MPIHDWTKTYAGAFHNLHGSWLFEIVKALNNGLLPKGYYALGEQVMGGAVPDVLTLEQRTGAAEEKSREQAAPQPLPGATLTAVADSPHYPPRPRVIAVRHTSRDRLVALIEIISSGNKNDAAEIGSLVEKTVVSLSKGIHVMLIDLHPPGAFDPEGIHNLIWQELDQTPTPFARERPLQVVSYLSEGRVRSFIEPRSVGEVLPDMPLFLTPTQHVLVPLESTYLTAFSAMPAHLRERLSRS